MKLILRRRSNKKGYFYKLCDDKNKELLMFSGKIFDTKEEAILEMVELKKRTITEIVDETGEAW